MKSALEIAMQSWVGRIVSERYQLEKVIGSGGCGAVFRARHVVTQRIIALKVIPSAGVDDSTARRFELEASAPALIDHPALVEVYDAGYDASNQCLFVAQELLHGHDLRTELELRGSLPWREAVQLLVPAMAAISAAHESGLIQRDIKPENIFLAQENGAIVAKVLDWGVALAAQRHTRVTTEGALVGTAWYLAPEIVSSSYNASEQSDVWALGCVLYECIAGNSPFDGDTAAAVLSAVLSEPVRLLSDFVSDVPVAVASVIARSLERDRRSRYRTMNEMTNDLLDAADMLSVPVRAPKRITSAFESAETVMTKRETTDAVTSRVRVRPRPRIGSRGVLIASTVSIAMSLSAAMYTAVRPSRVTPVRPTAAARVALPTKAPVVQVPPPVLVVAPVVPAPAPLPPPRHETVHRPRRITPRDAGVVQEERPSENRLPRNGAPVFEP